MDVHNSLDEELKVFRAELHVHTVLSPCAEVEMIPPLIIAEALAHNINLIAITDHNSSANIAAVQKAAKNFDITVLPGVELQTREEVHILCIFDTLAQIAAFQKTINNALPPIRNRPDYFGEQFVVDETGDFIKREDRLLLTSTDISLNDAAEEVDSLGGLFIPAHVNRSAFGLIGTLGFIPPNIHFEAVEISRHLRPADASRSFPQISGLPMIQSGDVHRLEEFLGVNEFRMKAPTVSEIRLALAGHEGRSFRILSHRTVDLIDEN
ncbi:MAG: PHP domain-containing protein [Anaerolineaceae bacterium]